MFRRPKSPKKVGEGENPFLLSFSDFMASLLAIFILIVIVEVIQLKQKEDDLKKEKEKIEAQNGARWVQKDEYEKLIALRSAVHDLVSKMTIFDSMRVGIDKSLNKVGQRRKALERVITQIQADLESQGVAVTPDISNLCLRFRDDKNGASAPKKLLFPSGSYKIPQESEETATLIGNALLKALSDKENQALIDTVFIEGHTDSKPYKGEMGNWGLSADRAISLWQFWTQNPGKLEGLKELKSRPEQGDPKPLISVSGYADTRSTYSAEDLSHMGQDRPDDRRIEIRFTLSPSEKVGLEDAQSAWNNVLNWFPGEIARLKKIINGN